MITSLRFNVKMLLVSILLFVFVVIVYCWWTSTFSLDRQQVCPRPDPTNCARYYNCADILMVCAQHQRFNLDTRHCEDFYLTKCGERNNDPFPVNNALCAPFYAGESTIDRFSNINCNQYVDCGSTFATLRLCPTGQLYSIEDQECRSADEVECGIRI
ncbi:hypothetical protein [Clostera anachoreta granulovirus]|uniref:Chitin-binding type-2 domain-containing protein n=1 Tax=Clostera anachoreta granulovirus TaxID=283675 RepID=F4ZKU1_9BBAC|nr:hypothetical protein ClanGV_gp064 [Clostera anachoreta granulovirus]AEB00352.1 hypothetical protein [Clostera anachoreta granulovirus]